MTPTGTTTEEDMKAAWAEYLQVWDKYRKDPRYETHRALDDAWRVYELVWHRYVVRPPAIQNEEGATS